MEKRGANLTSSQPCPPLAVAGAFTAHQPCTDTSRKNEDKCCKAERQVMCSSSGIIDSTEPKVAKRALGSNPRRQQFRSESRPWQRNNRLRSGSEKMTHWILNRNPTDKILKRPGCRHNEQRSIHGPELSWQQSFLGPSASTNPARTTRKQIHVPVVQDLHHNAFKVKASIFDMRSL